MIKVESLVKHHGDKLILNGTSLNVERGEVAVVIGPSGGGKSTFLRCLNGLECFEAGRIAIDGLALEPSLLHASRETVLATIRQRVGMVFQQFNLFPHRTVLQNVTEAPIHVKKFERARAEHEARLLLDRVGLLDKLHARPHTLSGGQQQRVAIARALAMEPEVLLFDEPTSALDPKMTREVLAVMADLARDGQTMIVVTHAMGFARRVAHTVHVFAQGSVVESGPPSQIFEAPHHAVTREFLSEAA